MNNRAGLGEGPAEAGVGRERAHLVPGDPPELVELRKIGVDDGVGGSDQKVAQVQMLMGRVCSPGRDVVDVDVERAGRGRMEDEAADPRLLEGLAKGHVLPRRLSGLGVPAGLEPAVELAVVEEQHPLAVRRHDEGAPREVALGDPAVEGIGMAPHEVEDPVAVSCLLLVGRGVATERLDEGGAGIGGRHEAAILPTVVWRRRRALAPRAMVRGVLC
jgi:hypothetical protein